MAQTLSIRKYYIVIYQSSRVKSAAFMRCVEVSHLALFFSLGTPTEPMSSAERYAFKNTIGKFFLRFLRTLS